MISQKEFIEYSLDEYNGFKFNLTISMVFLLPSFLVFLHPFFIVFIVGGVVPWWYTFKEFRSERLLKKFFNNNIRFPTQELHTYVVDNAFWEEFNEQMVVTIDNKHYTLEELKPSFNLYERKVLEHAFDRAYYYHDTDERVRKGDIAEKRREVLEKYFKEEEL